jgi:CheY-like chemotaxis protein
MPNNPCNILLIEDNKTDIDLIQRAMEKKDSNVHFDIARDGEQALTYVKQWEQGSPAPMMILLNLKLPKLDGLEVLRILKEHPRYKKVPVVVLTSSSDISQIHQAYKLGANSYVIKSVDYEQFAKAIVLIHHYWCELNIHPD